MDSMCTQAVLWAWETAYPYPMSVFLFLFGLALTGFNAWAAVKLYHRESLAIAKMNDE